MATKTIVAPSGLSVARSDNKFTLTWKRGASYTAQQVQYRINKGTWHNISVTASATTASLTLSKSSYNPNTSKRIESISFTVRGKVGSKWSSWVTTKYYPRAPYKPYVGTTPDDDLTNRARFSWNFTLSTTDERPFTNLEWQAIRIKNCDITDGSKINWSASGGDKRTGTSTSNESSTQITEDSATIAGGSYTRWFRARTRGMCANSYWNYTKRVYAAPYKATITSATATNDNSAIKCKVSWKAPTSASHPIDKTVVQYTKCVPIAGLKPPNDATWEDANLSADTLGYDSAYFSIDGTLSEDQCLFTRVNTHWVKDVTYGNAYLVSRGRLAEPSGVSVNTNTNTITATNESDVPDSFLAVIYRCEDDSFTIGVIPHGRTSVTVQPPDSGGKPVAYGVYAVVGTYETTVRADGVTSYAINAKMKSSEVWQGGSVPVAPENVSLSSTAVPGTIRVSWDWTWQSANRAVLSWADHDDAWESTDGPEEYTINNPHASHWNIGGLDTGKRWYVRIRLDNETEDATIEGPWSETQIIDLSSAPAVPSLATSSGFVTADASVTVFWSFVSTDGTGQAYAEICADTEDNIIAHTDVAQQVTFVPTDKGWAPGDTHMLKLKVWSESQKESDWSDPVYITVVHEIEATIESTSLDDAETEEIESLGADKVLKALPLSVTVSGIGDIGTANIKVYRATDYHIDRPDGSTFDGFKGESIALLDNVADGTVTIGIDDLIGSFDDGAKYTLEFTIKDNYGQSSTDSIDFGVNWSHQAVAPNGTVTVDYDRLIAKLTPQTVQGMTETDMCDIYRLSSDQPELIVSNAEYGVVYVDPYPAINGGYRFVCRTANGDYITADNMPAWVDVDSNFTYDRSIIDFNGEQVKLYYNLDLSNNWEKDFQATRYLGGSVKGDWNDGVVRTATLSTVTLNEFNADVINGLRLLAEYPGICHVRTLDGSSFKADLQVSEDRDHDDYGTKASFSISCTRVDPEELDGISFEEWNEGNE